jgi:hypothetical protein
VSVNNVNSVNSVNFLLPVFKARSWHLFENRCLSSIRKKTLKEEATAGWSILCLMVSDTDGIALVILIISLNYHHGCLGSSSVSFAVFAAAMMVIQ